MSGKNKYQITDELVEHFVKWSSGFLSSEKFNTLISLIESELSKYHVTREVESNLIRIISAVIDKVSFLRDALKYPHHSEIIAAISANSNYLTDIIVRNPEYLYQVFSPDYLKTPVKTINLQNEFDRNLKTFKSLDAKVRYLKAYKRRMLLKIGVNDILGHYNFEEVVESISSVAIKINEALFSLCYKEITTSHKLPDLPEFYCLISLGKLGGAELNYSSDIDLMIIYNLPESNEYREFDYYSLLNETTNLFVKQSTQFSDLGNLYRVDFRLRPDGSTAPIARTLLDTMNYYESRGEQWERQMLIKINFVGGDSRLFDKFSSFVTGYIYSNQNLSSPIEKIRGMKLNIEKLYPDSRNVKTGEGGIRDIEFCVQALQLLFGSGQKIIRTGNTLDALRLLCQVNLLNDEEYDVLKNSYIHFRRIEHFLQLMNNLQTHSIPSNPDVREQISRITGFNNFNAFEKDLSSRRKKVRGIYNSIINPVTEKKTDPSLKSIEVSFSDERRARKNFEFLEFGTGLIAQKNFDSKTTQLFHEIKNTLLDFLRNAFNPDRTLNNFAKLVSSYKYTSILYKELRSEKFFGTILQICEEGQYAVNLLINKPDYIEEIINRKLFSKNFQELIDNYNTEKLLLMLSVQFTLGLIDSEKLSSVLGIFIRKKILNLHRNTDFFNDTFIAGLGSFAVSDMTLKSDADIIVVTDNVMTKKYVQEIYTNLLLQIKEVIKPIDIDVRLRPEGKSSPIVWDLINYKNYLSKRAGVWEYQSLIKSDFISGNKKLFKKFQDTIVGRLSEIPSSAIKDSIKEMHSKVTQIKFLLGKPTLNLKTNPGGLITIDYLYTYLLLKRIKKKQKIDTEKSKLIILKDVIGKGKESDELIENYKMLKYNLLRGQTMFDSNKSSAIETLQGKELNRNQKRDGLLSVNEINSILKNNMKLFAKILDE